MSDQGTLEKTELQIGFIPILCSAPLVLAHARGLFEEAGLHVDLQRAPGWSGVKELMAHDKLDAAHMLSPMPLACNLGIDGARTELLLAAIQNVNGQALTLAARHLGIQDVRDMRGFCLGVPYRFSMHYYLLCHHLAAHGLDPLRDVTIVEVAPPNMPQYLEQGRVDGVFAPEPFNQIPVNQGTGFIHILSRDIWEGHPCCSFATTRAFAESNPNTYRALLRCVLQAEQTLHMATPEERRALARIMSNPEHLDLDDPLPAEQVLGGTFPDGKGGELQVLDRIDFVPHAFVEHGAWMLSQMQRWGQLAARVDYREVVESTFHGAETRELAEALGYGGDVRPNTAAMAFDAEDPFAYMKVQPFCRFDDAEKLPRPELLTGAARQRVAQLNHDLAGAVGGRFDASIEVTAGGELGRLEELVLNSRFANELLRDRNRRLRESEADLRLLFETLPIGWAEHELLLDEDGAPDDYVFLKVNRAFERFTGLRRRAIIGRRVTEIIPGIRQADPDLVAVYGEVTLTGQQRNMEIYFEPFDRWYQLTAFRRAARRFVVMFEDITARKQAEDRLRQKAEALQRSNKELEQFAYVASHDLQEPLRMVASYTELLSNRYGDQLDDRADKYIGYAVEGAHRMQRLINDLLTFSRIGTQSSPPEPVDCGPVLAQVLRGLQKAVEESGAQIEVKELPMVMVDPTLLGQVLQNLVANAIKFRGEAPPRVEVSAVARGDMWEITVADNGPGIDPRFHERIFTIFQRLHRRGEYPGSGIGLSIVKKIVERHGGQVRVDSAEGRGSRFYFTLPAAGQRE